MGELKHVLSVSTQISMRQYFQDEAELNKYSILKGNDLLMYT